MRHILLCGSMGAGKSTVGRLLSQRLGFAFCDLDRYIETHSGETIPEIFARDGEDAFRRRERHCLREVLTEQSSQVVALGGGAICSDDAWQLIASEDIVVWLQVAPQTAARRAATEAMGRPLLDDVEPVARLAELLSTRTRYYGRAAVFVNTDSSDVEAVVAAICERLEPGPVAIDVALGARSYPIVVSYRGVAAVADEFCRRFEVSKAAMVLDTNLERHYGADLRDAFAARGIELNTQVVSAGEKSKDCATWTRLLDAYIGWPADRKTPLIAFGGGVVGDLGGFVAASLYRGVPLMQVPTSLLAQVDSSVGGKTGINHRLGKNLIGAFYQPQLVHVDVTLLSTLPEREFFSGLAEVVKYGAIADLELFELLERSVPAISRREPKILATIIRRCLEIKADVVTKDEFDGGLRATLNYGHTLGHAIEAGAGYGQMFHGEAIATGMAWVNDLGERFGVCLDRAQNRRIRELLAAFQLPVDYGPWQRDEIVAITARDKKVRGDRVELILLTEIGQAKRVVVDLKALQNAALIA